MNEKKCIICEESFSGKRAELGYKICLDCGEILAKKEKQYKSKCTAPAYNKGAYMYVTPNSDPRSLGRKI